MPADRLLIWNLKDGWEPLCKFLDKPVPAVDIPRDNTTGDKQYVEDYLKSHPLYEKACQFFKFYMCMLLMLVLIVIGLIIFFMHVYEYF